MADVKISQLPAATSAAATDLLVIVQGATTKQLTNSLLFTNATLVSPALGTPASGNLINCAGYVLSNLNGLGANVATFLATPTSANLATAVSDETGTGALVFSDAPTLNSPSLVTPGLGVATATSVNKVAITAPATGATLTILDGKTFTVSHSITLAGTDGTTMTFPTTSATLARTDAANTFTGTQTFSGAQIYADLRAQSAAAPTIASAATIAPTTQILFVSGTTAIDTITPPAPISTGGGQITIIPTGLFTTTLAGNIALASTAVVGKALIMTYDSTTTKWYPSY